MAQVQSGRTLKYHLAVFCNSVNQNSGCPGRPGACACRQQDPQQLTPHLSPIFSTPRALRQGSWLLRCTYPFHADTVLTAKPASPCSCSAMPTTAPAPSPASPAQYMMASGLQVPPALLSHPQPIHQHILLSSSSRYIQTSASFQAHPQWQGTSP